MGKIEIKRQDYWALVKYSIKTLSRLGNIRPTFCLPLKTANLLRRVLGWEIEVVGYFLHLSKRSIFIREKRDKCSWPG